MSLRRTPLATNRRLRVGLPLIAAATCGCLASCGLMAVTRTDSATAGAPSVATSALTTPAITAPSTAATTTASPTVTPTALMAVGEQGDRVRELQARLKQLDLISGDVTGTLDGATTAAIAAFQTSASLPSTGVLDSPTWDAIRSATRTPTDDEMRNRGVAGPPLFAQGDSGAKVRELQARLKQIGWWTGDVGDTFTPAMSTQVKGFQAKRNLPADGVIDQRTLDRLIGMTRTPTSEELNNVTPAPLPVSAAGLDARCLDGGRVLCISKSARKLVYVVDGQAKLSLDVRFGSENNPTREGVFSVYRKNKDWVSTEYGSPMPYSMFFSGGEAVHYSSDFKARGYAGASHGCVNVRDLSSLAWLFDQVSIGDKVVVYR